MQAFICSSNMLLYCRTIAQQPGTSYPLSRFPGTTFPGSEQLARPINTTAMHVWAVSAYQAMGNKAEGYFHDMDFRPDVRNNTDGRRGQKLVV